MTAMGTAGQPLPQARSSEAGAARTSTVTPILPALEIDAIGDLAWSDGADVLVVGWGLAGACAAIEARAAGAATLVIDRFGGGGASTLSGGVVYAGGGTRQQQAAGFTDTPQAMQDYLRHEVEDCVAPATLARFCAESAGNLAWLEAHGARFGATTSAHKTSYPPDGVFLYYSGSEMVPAFRGAAAPVPRGHRALSKGQSGAALYTALQLATEKAGARVLRQAAVRRLVRLRDGGRVIGVEAWVLPAGDPRTRRHAELDVRIAHWRLYHPGKAAAARREQVDIERALAQPRYLRAGRAIVLATGGYIYNPQMMAEHAPGYRAGWPIGGAGCDGSGVRLGTSVGAATARLDNVSAWRFITPPYCWPKGLVVNLHGERFCNEQVYGARLGYEIVEHQGGKAWLILDARLRRQAIRECLFGRLWAFQSLPALMLMLAGSPKARSLAGLAQRIGADPATLEATVATANAAARGERDDPFGKSPDLRQACIRPPFQALDISLGARRFPLATLSLGGLVVDETDGHLRDAQGNALPGLFAAGRAAVGIASAHYVSGLSLADCVFSGRRAGRAAALETVAGDAP